MADRRLPRRAFLRLAVGGVATAAVGGVATAAVGGVATVAGEASATAGAKAMAQHREGLNLAPSADYALVIDATRCRGDGACVEGCRLENGLPEGQSYIHLLQKGDQHVHWFLPIQCQHCAAPPCATVCPTKATYTRDDGVVLVNPRLCVGCKYCMTACPYQARIFDEERGVVDKCWLCLGRIHDGKPPACVEACVVGARIFGRSDDPDSEVSKLIASGHARPLHPEFNTRPNIVTYVIEE